MANQQKGSLFHIIATSVILSTSFGLAGSTPAADNDNGLSQLVAGAYLMPIRVESPQGFQPPSFDSLIVLHEDGTVSTDFSLFSPGQDRSAGFGVWKRVAGNAQARRIRIRYIAFHGNETAVPAVRDGFPLNTGRADIVVQFDENFQRFEGRFTYKVFCSNETFCGRVQDALVDQDPIITFAGDLVARRIRIR